MRNIDIDREIERISAFIKGYFSEAGFSKAVIGLCGFSRLDGQSPRT
jgi:NH3-dependent NAD+ synthetase